MRTRISYSQNLLKSPKIAQYLLGVTSITNQDTVVEIGPGNGIITDELLKICYKVIAIEIDKNLCTKLLNRFQNNSKIEIINQDFLDYSLPNYSYKVFSNIPFSKSSEIVRKLVFSDNPPEDIYLFYQEDAAKHLISRSLLSTLIGVNFKVSIVHHFKSDNFVPQPSVSVVLMRIEKVEPKISPNEQENFRDFVTYFFNQTKPNISESVGKVVSKEKFNNFAQQGTFSHKSKPSELSIENWIKIFEFVSSTNPQFLNKIKDTFENYQFLQSRLPKIHRTRVDKEWRIK